MLAVESEETMDLEVGTSSATLLERDALISDVERLGADAAAGTGRIVVVEAGAGLGKTAFLDESARRLAGSGFRLLAARGSELEHDFPYAIVRQLVAGLRRPADLRRAVLAGPAEPAAALFGDPAAAAPGSAADEQGEPFRIMNALYWAMANLCDLGPVAVLVDDAHEGDDASLRFLGFLARRLADLPLLLVVAARPAHGTSAAPLLIALGEAESATSVALPPLSHDAVSAVLRSSLDVDPPPEFVTECARATGGNPFYLRELVRAVADVAEGPAGVSAQLLADLGPETIARRVMSRMASLPPAVIPLARACAVLGEGARLPICADLAEISLDDAALAADALVREGVFAAGPYLSFLHPILQAVVLADLGEHSRKRWHARAADVLERAGFPPAIVALHLIRTDPSGDARIRAVLVRAGLAAAREGSTAAAAQYLQRALDESGAEPDAELLYELGLTQVSLGDAAGIAHINAGVEATVDPYDRATRALKLANLFMRYGRIVDAVRTLDAVRAGITADRELLLTVDATRYWSGRLAPETRPIAMEVAASLRAQVEPAGGSGDVDSPGRRTLLAYLGCEAAQTESASASTALLDRALAPPGLLTFVAFDAVATQATMLSLLSTERYDEFDALADSVLGEAGARGAVLAFLVVSTFRTLAMWHRGDLAAADTEGRESLRAAAEQGWRHGAMALTALRAIALLDQGDQVAAAQAMTDAGGAVVPPGFPTAMLRFAEGRIAAARGDLDAGLQGIRAAGHALEEMQIVSPGVLPWRSAAAEVLVQLGEPAEAEVLARAEVELARQLSGPLAVGRAMYARSRALRGEERVVCLEEAHAVLQTSPGRLVRAATCVDLGSALRQHKRQTDAKDLLTTGLDLAAACSAAPLVARAREELAVLGVAPRRPRVHGPDALTPSEIRVARLAADGRSNSEIAQRLFVTRKTVEKHLASTYRKLAIQSRAELATVDLSERPLD
jgi:DNA-binding CsgD family transcriptional regulator